MLPWRFLLVSVAGSAVSPGTCPAHAPDGACEADGEESLLLQVRERKVEEHVEEGVAAAHPSEFLAHVVPVTSASEFPEPRRHARKALAFSGGGSRSLSLVMGQLRALEKIGVLPGNVDAISAVSGGTWATSQYYFVRKSCEELLGKPTVPSQLDMKTLSGSLPDMATGANTSIGVEGITYLGFNLAGCQLKWNSDDRAKCVDHVLSNGWIKVIGEAFLGPYGLDKPKFMAASPEHVEQIIARNPGLKQHDFETPRQDRPKTFVMNGALLAPVGYIATENNTVSFQMSPDYTGSPFHPDGDPNRYYKSVLQDTNYFVQPLHSPGIPVGGGFVESFAFGGQAPVGWNSWSHPTSVGAPKTPFSLADAVGISSAAFASALTKLYPTTKFAPQKPYWPVTHFEREARIFGLGDGGNIENFGLLAMLQNKATSVAVFINTAVALNTSKDLCQLSVQEDLTNAASSSLSCLFGFCNQPLIERLQDPYGKDQVFKKAEYPPLLCSLQRLMLQGKPCIVQQKLEVLENSWWGIRGASLVDIIWVYNEKVLDFERQLPPDTQAQLRLGAVGAFNHFPHYLTVEQNPPQVVSLTKEQINLLAAQGEYSLLQHQDEFCSMFGCGSSQ